MRDSRVRQFGADQRRAMAGGPPLPPPSGSNSTPLPRTQLGKGSSEKKIRLVVQKKADLPAPAAFQPPKVQLCPGSGTPPLATTFPPRRHFNAPPVVQRLPLKRAEPKHEAIDLETANFQKFKSAVEALVRLNEELVYVVFDELIAAIGWDPRLRVEHRPHIEFLQDLMNRVETYRARQEELLEHETREAEKRKQRAEEKALLAHEKTKDRLRAKYSAIPKQTLDLSLIGEPNEDLLVLLAYVYSNKPATARQAWADLVLHKKGSSLPLLTRLVSSSVLTLPQCTKILNLHGINWGTDEVDQCEAAFALRGNGEGHIPLSISTDDIIEFVFAGSTAAMLTWVFHAPGRDVKSLVAAIRFRNMTESDVKRVAACPHVSLDICGASLVALRTLSVVEVGILDVAATALLDAGEHLSSALVATIAGHLGGLVGLTNEQKATYASARVLYKNLSEIVIRQIVLNNGDNADRTLRVFNAKVVGCPIALAWAVRNDLAHAIYAPTGAGTWSFHYEIIDDMLGWRGAGASHGCFTFAEILDARDRATGSLGGAAAPDHNEGIELFVGLKRTRIIVNRAQRKIITIFTI